MSVEMQEYVGTVTVVEGNTCTFQITVDGKDQIVKVEYKGDEPAPHEVGEQVVFRDINGRWDIFPLSKGTA